MKIWKEEPTVEELNQRTQETIHRSLGIQYTCIGDDFLEASMPVDSRTIQPMGYLHGGASLVLAESLGSTASSLYLGAGIPCVGVEINASHLRSAREGIVLGRVTPIRLGSSIHVWEIRIRLASELICVSRLTVYVKPLKPVGESSG
jgi:1,4-dihydroxy-2-naphthoyl-CoA hydrolase